VSSFSSVVTGIICYLKANTATDSMGEVGNSFLCDSLNKLTYLVSYLFSYLLHGAESFLRN